MNEPFTRASTLSTRSRALAGLVLCSTLIGCINSLSANLTPGTRVPQAARLYHVLTGSDDSEHVDQLIVHRLLAMGFQATAGSREATPADADVVVTYRDKWMWDMTLYLLDLTITLRKPQSGFPLVEGNAMHGSTTRRSPEMMVDEVLTEIFRKVKEGN